jgi:DnaJ-class molecular chaperone
MQKGYRVEDELLRPVRVPVARAAESREVLRGESAQDIGEADAVLSEPEKRARQDQLGPNWKTGMEFTPPPDGPGMRGEHGDFKDRTGAGEFSGFFVSLFGGHRGEGRATWPDWGERR